ncbi:XdhC family protein [Nocardioides soli]|uniref:Xanthine dehydrogenase accessory factor n=1 Tax=Nocardioides soli TaxID=1036020 RepID=A0A7W4VW12_9ACTN|nr:XdhC family protein [Nocardioides soli]MBB3042372.1 xanthine dehydrogenase accessory factor [Nocardioides soli]
MNEQDFAGQEYAVATVVWRQAPSSGQIGSRAIVTADGQIHGWIGGACAEPTVIREAQRVIREGEARLLYLGASDDLVLPEGMTAIPMSCQSEGALQVYVEPVHPPVHLVVVGRSPMAELLTELARVLGWRAELVDGAGFTAADVDERAVVVVATQGHHDEDVIRHAASARPAYVGLVASHKRGEAVLGYLADRGVPPDLLERVHTPVGLDLGHTTHREIAVSILAELVRVRAAGGLAVEPGRRELPLLPTAEALDPVCGMTVPADDAHFPLEVDGTTYHFCCVGCRDAFLTRTEA